MRMSKNILDKIQNALNKLTNKARVAPIKIPKGQNLKGWKMNFTPDDVGAGIGSNDLRKKIELDPLAYSDDRLDELAERYKEYYRNKYSTKDRSILEEFSDPMPYLDTGFDVPYAKAYLNEKISGELPEYATKSYKIVNAYPDGSVKLRVCRDKPKYNTIDCHNYLYDPKYDSGIFFNVARNRAKSGSTGQWINNLSPEDPSRIHHVDFNDRVPVEWVRNKDLDGYNQTDFNKNLKKYREGFPVSELDNSYDDSRLNTYKRNFREIPSTDPLVYNEENKSTGLMKDLKIRADEIREEKIRSEYEERLNELEEQRKKVLDKMEKLRNKADSLYNVQSGINREVRSRVRDSRRYR